MEKKTNMAARTHQNIVILNGRNFNRWKFNINLTLEANDLLEVVDGTEVMCKKEGNVSFLFSIVLGNLLAKIRSTEVTMGLLEQPDTLDLLNSLIRSILPLFIYRV